MELVSVNLAAILRFHEVLIKLTFTDRPACRCMRTGLKTRRRTALICVGLSHRSSSMQQRVRQTWSIIGERCLQHVDGAEWALLSTCNRIELYLAIEGAPADVVTELPLHSRSHRPR